MFFYEDGRGSGTLKESIQAPPHQTLPVVFEKAPFIRPDPPRGKRDDVGRTALVVKELGGTHGILAQVSALP